MKKYLTIAHCADGDVIINNKHQKYSNSAFEAKEIADAHLSICDNIEVVEVDATPNKNLTVEDFFYLFNNHRYFEVNINNYASYYLTEEEATIMSQLVDYDSDSWGLFKSGNLYCVLFASRYYINNKKYIVFDANTNIVDVYTTLYKALTNKDYYNKVAQERVTEKTKEYKIKGYMDQNIEVTFDNNTFPTIEEAYNEAKQHIPFCDVNITEASTGLVIIFKSDEIEVWNKKPFVHFTYPPTTGIKEILDEVFIV